MTTALAGIHSASARIIQRIVATTKTQFPRSVLAVLACVTVALQGRVITLLLPTVSFWQACVNGFEACGIVGCQLTILGRTADGYQGDTWPSLASGSRATANRALASGSQSPLAHPRFAVGLGGGGGPQLRGSPRRQGACGSTTTRSRNGLDRKRLPPRAGIKGVAWLPFWSWPLLGRLASANALWSWRTLVGRRCGST